MESYTTSATNTSLQLWRTISNKMTHKPTLETQTTWTKLNSRVSHVTTSRGKEGQSLSRLPSKHGLHFRSSLKCIINSNKVLQLQNLLNILMQPIHIMAPTCLHILDQACTRRKVGNVLSHRQSSTWSLNSAIESLTQYGDRKLNHKAPSSTTQ